MQTTDTGNTGAGPAAEKVRIAKGSVQETLIVPLYGRKICAEQFPTFYQDPYAAEVCTRIDYDFEQFKDKESSTIYQFGGLEAAVREKDMLWEIGDYLQSHPTAAVVNLGCGLNMTGRSADNGQCKIYNFDFPQIIELRDQLLPAGPREFNIAADLNDFAWMDKIDASGGAVFYAAGVFHYFTTQQVKDMALTLAQRFPDGRLVFDSVGKFGRDKLMKGTLKNMGMNDISGLFYVKDVADLKGWSDKITVSQRPYMLGYYNLDDPNIKGSQRLMAKLCDSVVKMAINRFDF